MEDISSHTDEIERTKKTKKMDKKAKDDLAKATKGRRSTEEPAKPPTDKAAKKKHKKKNDESEDERPKKSKDKIKKEKAKNESKKKTKKQELDNQTTVDNLTLPSFLSDGSSSSSSTSSSLTHKSKNDLMASSPPKLGSHPSSSRGGPQFASAPALSTSSHSIRAEPDDASSSPFHEVYSSRRRSNTVAAPSSDPWSQPRIGRSMSVVEETHGPRRGPNQLDSGRSRRGGPECVMEGFLEEAQLKRMGSSHTRRVSKWRRRWVRLVRSDAGTFLLTHDKQPVGKKASVVRSRVDVLAMTRAEKRDDVRRNTFVLMPDCDRQPPFYFCADSDSERASWLAAVARMQKEEMRDVAGAFQRRPTVTGAGMTTVDFDDEEEEAYRREKMILINGEEKKDGRGSKKVHAFEIKEEQDQTDGDDEEARMMQDIERRMREMTAHHQQYQQPSNFHTMPPAMALSMAPAYHHAQGAYHQPQPQPQHQQGRRPSLVAVTPVPVPGQTSTVSGSYNPFLDVASQQQPPVSYFINPPVRRGSLAGSDLSDSRASLPQAQTVVMSTLSASMLPASPGSVSPHGTPPSGMPALSTTLSAAGPPTPHIPPPFMRTSSNIRPLLSSTSPAGVNQPSPVESFPLTLINCAQV